MKFIGLGKKLAGKFTTIMEFFNGPIVMALIFVFNNDNRSTNPFAAGIATVAGLIIADIPLSLMALSAWTAFEPFPLVTIPLFI